MTWPWIWMVERWRIVGHPLWYDDSSFIPQVLYVFPATNVTTRGVALPWSQAGDLANGIVKCIMDPRSKNQDGFLHGWGLLRAMGPWYLHLYPLNYHLQSLVRASRCLFPRGKNSLIQSSAVCRFLAAGLQYLYCCWPYWNLVAAVQWDISSHDLTTGVEGLGVGGSHLETTQGTRCVLYADKAWIIWDKYLMDPWNFIYYVMMQLGMKKGSK